MAMIRILCTVADRARLRIRRIKRPARSQAALHDYWRSPDADNSPEHYLAPDAAVRSEYLVRLIRERCGLGPLAAILEVGCNAGRNLQFLHEEGYQNLAAVEISAPAIELLRHSFPEMAARLTLHQGAAEEELQKLPDKTFELVYTMAVLEHIHEDGEVVLDQIARVCGRHLITIEDEHKVSWRHFPRDYRRVFEARGLRQVFSERCDPERHGLTAVHVVRVFEVE
jgi:2-polyprenyl-3-methyl-5-hydroxy-6-metoxy-1,4-benzoquinol methylase